MLPNLCPLYLIVWKEEKKKIAITIFQYGLPTLNQTACAVLFFYFWAIWHLYSAVWCTFHSLVKTIRKFWVRLHAVKGGGWCSPWVWFVHSYEEGTWKLSAGTREDASFMDRTGHFWGPITVGVLVKPQNLSGTREARPGLKRVYTGNTTS